MSYQNIQLRSIPVVVHSHRFTTTCYNIPFKAIPHHLEISYIEQGAVEIYKEDRLLYTLPEKSIVINFYEQPLRFVSKAPVHSHVTVGLVGDYVMSPMSSKDVLACSRMHSSHQPEYMAAILPYQNKMILDHNSRIYRLFDKIIQTNTGALGEHSLETSALAMTLMAEISKECVRQCYVNLQLPPSDIVYTERAMDYIAAHLSQKIEVQDIARAVGISSGYLSGIFKTVTGKTMVEYINLAKLQRVTELVSSLGISAGEAAEQVGITDPSYLSRLFRKYLDTGIRDIKQEKDKLERGNR